MKAKKRIWIGIIVTTVILAACGCHSKGFSYRTLERHARKEAAEHIDAASEFYVFENEEDEWARYISVSGDDAKEVFDKIIDQRGAYRYADLPITDAFYMQISERVDDGRNKAWTNIYMITFETEEAAQDFFDSSHYEGAPSGNGEDYSYVYSLRKYPRGTVGSCMYLQGRSVMKFYTNMPISESWDRIRAICKDFGVIIPEADQEA
ncbi:MAG: hypothetical protein IK020_00200 [Clostridiales bacterium]|nr:hypothetical protein [Clostridiales bacterium]